MNETKPKRRWFRFSLRTLLVAITSICVLIAAVLFWYRGQEHEHGCQENIALRLKTLGAQVLWEKQTPGFLRWSSNLPISEAFQRIYSVSSDNSTIGDANTNKILDELRDISSVRSVAIPVHPYFDFGGRPRYAHYRELSDDTIRRLNDISSLEELTLYFAGGGNGVYWPDAERRAAISDIHKKLPRVKVMSAGGFG